MYKIKPIVEVWPDVNLPANMYNMKSVVNLQLEEGAMHPDIGIELTEIDSLVARQHKLLHQLEEFQKQLGVIKQELSAKSSTGQPGSKAATGAIPKTKVGGPPIDTSKLTEIAVQTSLNHIPYSLLGLQKLWAGLLNLNILSYRHSSLPAYTEKVEQFIALAGAFQPQDDLPTLLVRVIFKEIDTLKFLQTPDVYFALNGEVNLVRFLSRIGPQEFNYESNLNDALDNDTILDAAHLLLRVKNDKEQLDSLRLLNKKLGKQHFFGGNSPSVADIAVSSSLRQIEVTKKIAPALSAWLDRAGKALGY